MAENEIEVVTLEHPHTKDRQQVQSNDQQMVVLMGHGYVQVLAGPAKIEDKGVDEEECPQESNS